MNRIVPEEIIIRETAYRENDGVLRDNPNTKGYWELQNNQDGTCSKWNVLFNNNWPLPGSGGWIATNGITTCMCSSLSGQWRKISERFQPGADICEADIYENSRIKRKEKLK